jgi:hypothetical protein
LFSTTSFLLQIFCHQYLIHRLIGRQHEYGRLYNNTLLGSLVARVCGRHAYYKGGEDDKYELRDRLIVFNSEKWDTCIEEFVTIRNSLVRKDASLMVLPAEVEEVPGADEEDTDLIPDEDDEVDPEVDSSEAFSESFLQMKEWFKFHACLSCLQPQFENAIQNGTDVIPHKSIVAFE